MPHDDISFIARQVILMYYCTTAVPPGTGEHLGCPVEDTLISCLLRNNQLF